MTPEDVSGVLNAPVENGVNSGGIDTRTGEPKEGYRFSSPFSSYDRVKIWIDTGSTTSNSFNRLRNDAKSPIDVPGLGESTYASLSRNGVLQVKILGKESWDQSHGGMAKRGSILTISLYLKPKATQDDLSKLTELARLMYSRYGGIEPHSIPGQSNSGNTNSGNLGSGDLDSEKKGFFGKIEGGLKALGEKSVGGVKSSGERIKGSISNKGGVSRSQSGIRQSWRSFLSGNTPSLPNTGDYAYSHYVESSQPALQVGALLGNSRLHIKWRGNARFPTAPKSVDTDKLIGLLKLAISRLN